MANYDGGAAREKRADLKKWQESQRVDPDAYPVLSAFANPLMPPARDIIGREGERDQVLSAMYRPELSSVVLLADAGTGKALADDTLVPVDDSRVFAEISDIAVGDYVFGRDGTPTPVIGVFPQGVKSAFRVITEFGEPLVVNDEHIWTVYDLRRGCEITTTLSDMLSQGLFLHGGKPRFLVPCGEGVQRSASFDFDKGVGRHGVILPDALGGSLIERNDLVAVLDDHFVIEPAGRDCVRLRTGDGEMAHTVASLLSGTGQLARVDMGLDGELCDVLWRRTPQEYQPIMDVEPMGSVPMTCIKVMADDGLFQAGLGHVVTHNTALVQSVMQRDPDRLYLEVDPAKLIAGLNSDKEMGDRLKRLFEDAENYAASESTELVIFIDEFHQIVQLSEAAVEALKPVLADAGTRGLRIVGATTFEEYNEHIKKNQPLMQRLQPIRVNSPDNETTVKILRGFTHQYGVADQITGDEILRQIVEITNTYMPADSQPRKSVRVLDAMVGVHRYTGRAMDVGMMHEVIEESMGISLAFGVDGQAIKESLDAKVYAQDNASTVLNRRLQLCVANLNNPDQPMMSALFVGSTGVGKDLVDKTIVPVFDSSDGVSWKRHGNLEPGDYVFDRCGRPTEVLGVFPQGMQDVYRVTFTDGRTLDAGGPHLWGVYTAKMRANKNNGKDVDFKVMSTLELLESGVVRSYPGDTREHLKYLVPMNEAVQWPEQDYELDPYSLGAFIGNGAATCPGFTITGDDEYVIAKVATSIGAEYRKDSVHNYNWSFLTGKRTVNGGAKHFQTKDVLASVPELINCYSKDRRIPDQYMHGSVEQRWELVRGLFDTDGTIDPTTGRFNVSYSTFSKGLAEDVRQLLFSLGVSTSLNVWTRTKVDNNGRSREMIEYDVHVRVGNEEKVDFFSLPRKRDIAEQAIVQTSNRTRVKKFDMVGIKSIEKLPEQEESSCIYVANAEHLYQAGQFVVTHNTEMTKQLTNLMFGDDVKRLIRFDMSEFAEETSLEVFRDELTQRVSNMGHAVILFDEVEKASKWHNRLLLQVLDDGRLSDRYGRTTSFLNTYIVLTTNAGSKIFNDIGEYAASDTGDGDSLDDYLKLIESNLRDQGDFPAELLGRIDEIVPFQPLSRETKRKIIQNKLLSLRNNVAAKHGVTLRIDPSIVQYLTDDLSSTTADEGGAREATRILEQQVATEVATFLNAHPGVRTISVTVAGQMWTDNKYIRKTRAYPFVFADD